MNCNECLDLINPYLDGELEKQLHTEVESHLVNCSGCSEEASDWQASLRRLQETFPEQMPPPELWEKIQARTKAQ